MRHLVILTFGLLLCTACSKKEERPTPPVSAVQQAVPAEAPEEVAEDEAPEGSDEPAPEDGKAACALLSEAEATTHLGFPVTQEEIGHRECRWESEEFKPGIRLTLVVKDDPSELDTYSGTADAAPVAGLGEKAVWAPAVGVLVIVKDGRSAVLDLDNKITPTDLKPKALAVGKLVAERM